MGKKSEDEKRNTNANSDAKKDDKSPPSSSSSSSSERITAEDLDANELNNNEKATTPKQVITGNDKVPTTYELNEHPGVLTTEELAEASDGVSKTDPERNENFDTRFYKNQIPVRQHDPTATPERRALRQLEGESEAELYVIAKRVADGVDDACWITVRQTKHLGSGRFSDVYTGTVLVGNKYLRSKSEVASSPMPVAIKKLWPDKSREDLQICTHRLLHHHNVVGLLFYFVCIHPKSKTPVWMMILEPMPSTLTNEQAKYIDRQRLMPRTYVKVFTYQLMSGLGYMERKQILHRDIKPDNLLVDMETGRLKIGDLGSSKVYRENCPSSSYIVTRYYRAPEICLKYKYYGPSVDIWSAGCILCGMLTNRVLFYGQNNDDQLKKIVNICGTPTREQMRQCAPGIDVPRSLYHLKAPQANWYRILSRFNEKITMECADFVTSVLRYEADARLRGEKALNHPYFDSLREPGRLLPNHRPLPMLLP